MSLRKAHQIRLKQISNDIQWVLGLSEPKLLEKVKYIMASESKTDWWNDISEAGKNAINEGLIQIQAGQAISHQEVKKVYAKKL